MSVCHSGILIDGDTLCVSPFQISLARKPDISITGTLDEVKRIIQHLDPEHLRCFATAKNGSSRLLCIAIVRNNKLLISAIVISGKQQ